LALSSNTADSAVGLGTNDEGEFLRSG